MKVFRSALFDPSKKTVTPSVERPGIWTVRFARLPFYDYFRKPERMNCAPSTATHLK